MKIFPIVILWVLIVCTANHVSVSAQRTLPSAVESCSVLLSLRHANGTSWRASGFYFNDKHSLYLVTARHVLFAPSTTPDVTNLAAIAEGLSYHGYDDTNTIVRRFDLPQLFTNDCVKWHTNHDVAVVRLGKFAGVGTNPQENVTQFNPGVEILKSGMAWEISSDMVVKYGSVFLGNDAFILGYPISVGTQGQLAPERPLLRKGCISGKNPVRETLILDAAAYKGNSGGPVFQLEQDFTVRKIALLGVVSQFIPLIDNRQSSLYGQITQIDIANSGYAVVEPMDFVLELLLKN